MDTLVKERFEAWDFFWYNLLNYSTIELRLLLLFLPLLHVIQSGINMCGTHFPTLAYPVLIFRDQIK